MTDPGSMMDGVHPPSGVVEPKGRIERLSRLIGKYNLLS